VKYSKTKNVNEVKYCLHRLDLLWSCWSSLHWLDHADLLLKTKEMLCDWATLRNAPWIILMPTVCNCQALTQKILNEKILPCSILEKSQERL